jgi:hypothetical protein
LSYPGPAVFAKATIWTISPSRSKVQPSLRLGPSGVIVT